MLKFRFDQRITILVKNGIQKSKSLDLGAEPLHIKPCIFSGWCLCSLRVPVYDSVKSKTFSWLFMNWD